MRDLIIVVLIIYVFLQSARIEKNENQIRQLQIQTIELEQKTKIV